MRVCPQSAHDGCCGWPPPPLFQRVGGGRSACLPPFAAWAGESRMYSNIWVPGEPHAVVGNKASEWRADGRGGSGVYPFSDGYRAFSESVKTEELIKERMESGTTGGKECIPCSTDHFARRRAALATDSTSRGLFGTNELHESGLAMYLHSAARLVDHISPSTSAAAGSEDLNQGRGSPR